jgi:regulator of protease activity HflC (stomatin/prohibitin superfamily)
LWQGIILPIAFVISLFNHNVSIYEVYNNGIWYNFGFFLGCGIIFKIPFEFTFRLGNTQKKKVEISQHESFEPNLNSKKEPPTSAQVE